MPQIESKINQGHKIHHCRTMLSCNKINHNWVYQKYMKNNALLKYKSVINSLPEYVYPVYHFILPGVHIKDTLAGLC